MNETPKFKLGLENVFTFSFCRFDAVELEFMTLFKYIGSFVFSAFFADEVY